MVKKKNNITLIIPAFLLIGTAIGIQTKNLFKQMIVGLIVGIIAYIAYNYLVTKVEKVIFQMEARTTEFLDHIHHSE